MKRRSRRNNEENALDLTPMMDIVFIMLIFFIVTTSFVKETGVDINRPNAETAERDEKGNILVALTENNEIWIDKRRVDLKAVRANIERLELCPKSHHNQKDRLSLRLKLMTQSHPLCKI